MRRFFETINSMIDNFVSEELFCELPYIRLLSAKAAQPQGMAVSCECKNP